MQVNQSGPIVAAVMRHIQRCEIDPAFLSGETVAYKVAVVEAVPAVRQQCLWLRLCEESTRDYTVALSIARGRQLVPRVALMLAQREFPRRLAVTA